MKFHNQMIKKTYDHTADILNALVYDNDFLKVKKLADDNELIYQAVLSDYRYRMITSRQIDFFYDAAYYEEIVNSILVEAQLGSGMAEQNMILYNVNRIIDTTAEKLRNYREKNQSFANIGYIGVDMTKKQMFITDIQGKYAAYYQLMFDRNLDQVFGTGNNFRYDIRFRFVSREA